MVQQHKRGRGGRGGRGRGGGRGGRGRSGGRGRGNRANNNNKSTANSDSSKKTNRNDYNKREGLISTGQRNNYTKPRAAPPIKPQAPLKKNGEKGAEGMFLPLEVLL